MNRVALTLICLALVSTASLAQGITEYGKPDELKGVTKIFIFTGAEMKDRERIIKELEKSKKKAPDLVIVDRPADAEVVLVYSVTNEEWVSSIRTNPNAGSSDSTSTPIYMDTDTGTGRVIKPLPDGGMRLLMSFKDEQTYRWARNPVTNFARAFMKAYLKANGDASNK
jgi:hypothetical protein